MPLTAFSGLLGVLSILAPIYPDSSMLALITLLPLTFTTVGAVVASRRSESPIGWILCVGGLVLSVASSANNYEEYALRTKSPDPLPGVDYAGWFTEWVALPTLFLAATMLLLLFPNGRFVSPEWRFVAGVAVIAYLMSALGGALTNPPVAIGGAVGNFSLMLEGFGSVLLLLSCVASVASSFARWVQARGQERQQLKWFAYAAALMIGGFLLTFSFGGSLEPMWDLGFLVGILGFAALPLATAIAILRHRLYDIDVIINRTLVYGALTAALAAVYFGGVVVSQRLFVVLTGERSTLAVVASTLLIAALFQPLRRRIQSFIDRRFYRRKYDAAKMLAAFNARLRDETELETLSGEVVGVVRETMQPAHVSLWLRPDTASKGNPAD